MILFVGLNVLVLAGFCLWLARREWSLLDVLLAAFRLLAAQILRVEMLLAAAGHLRPGSAAGVHLTLAAVVWAGTGRDIPNSARWIWRDLRTMANLGA